MACVLFPFVSKMCPKVSLNKAIVLSSALFSAKLKLFSAEVWKCQHFSAQRRNYQEATARNLFIRDNFDSTSHTALFLREPKQFGRCFSFFFFFFFFCVSVWVAWCQFCPKQTFFSYWQNQVCFRNLPIVGVACVGFTDLFLFILSIVSLFNF